MEYFLVRYDSRVVNYDCRGFIRLATGWILFALVLIVSNISANAQAQNRYLLVYCMKNSSDYFYPIRLFISEKQIYAPLKFVTAGTFLSGFDRIWWLWSDFDEFGQLSTKFDRLSTKFDRLLSKFDRLSTKLDWISMTLIGFRWIWSTFKQIWSTFNKIRSNFDDFDQLSIKFRWLWSTDEKKKIDVVVVGKWNAQKVVERLSSSIDRAKVQDEKRGFLSRKVIQKQDRNWKNCTLKSPCRRAAVVAQLVQRLLPTPEVRGSNPVIGEIYIEHCFLSTV